VASLSNVKNPIAAALAVMDYSDHVMLAGHGAEEFAKSQKLEMVNNDYFTTPQILRSWERSQSEGSLSPESRAFEKFGTVGCVALDSKGNIAAGTSTGGLMNKSYGRIGDSPIIGAGTYADNETCGVSCTGQGEYYIRLCVAKEISDQIAFGKKSLDESMAYTLKRLSEMEAFGGMIAIDKFGNVSMEFNTPSMYRGMRKGKKSTIHLFGKVRGE
jgi:beta-aspartyl-peptidase (threonine type)